MRQLLNKDPLAERLPGLGFIRKNGELFLGSTSLKDLAENHGTPLYVYNFDGIFSRSSEICILLKSFRKGSKAFYAVKALSNLSIIRLIHRAGLGMDVVSQGELERCLAAGVPATDIIFSGVAKTQDEINRGVDVGIHCFNIESPYEFERLKMATHQYNKSANVALRINPEIDAHTHSKITTGTSDSKFGLTKTDALELTQKILGCPSLKLIGLSCHIGSQISKIEVIQKTAIELNKLSKILLKMGAPLSHIDMGGGLGVAYKPYEQQLFPSFESWIEAASSACPNQSISLYLEPGRAVVAESGILLTKIIDIKQGHSVKFAMVDVGMSEIIRPALYDAYHHIENLLQTSKTLKNEIYDVVGPVCESSCWLGRNVSLTKPKINELLVIFGAGAYASTMSSNYNSRARPAEIAVQDGRSWIIRKRETLSSLWDLERLDEIKPIQ